MRLLIAFILTCLYMVPLWLSAQMNPIQYIWHRKGVPVYSEPSSQIAIDTLSFGRQVNVIEIQKQAVSLPLFNYSAERATKVYNSTSKWMLIEFGNRQRGYVLNTYLLEFPTNRTAQMIDYFRELSPIVEKRTEGKTEQFCNRSSFAYKNGIRYTYTDLGPCEACGHIVTEITFPGWTLRQAFVFLTNFNANRWDMNGKSTVSYLEHRDAIQVKESYTSQFQWEHKNDLVTLTETKEGIQVQIDTIL